MRAANWRAAFWGMVALAVSQGALAEDAKGGAIEKARDHMEKGQELYLRGRFAEAADEFKQAYSIQPFSAFLYNAAVAYERHGDVAQAAEFFSRYLAQDPQTRDAPSIKQRLKDLQVRLMSGVAPVPGQSETPVVAPPPAEASPTEPASSAPPAAATTELPRDFKSLLSIRTNPEGAKVTVKQGGKVLAEGESPFGHTLEEGEYRLVINHPAYRTVEETVHVRPGKVYVVIVEMSQGRFLGYLRLITSVPGAKVFIDDHKHGAVGRTPFQGPLPTGAHKVWLERPGYEPIEKTVQVGVGEDVIVRAELKRVSYGRLRIVADRRDAKVYVDGKLSGAVPFDGKVDAGEHVVRVEAEDMKAWEQRITIERGQATPIRVRLRRSVSRTGAWITAGIAVAAVGTGIALGLMANARSSDLEADRDRGRLATNDSRLLEGKILSIGADGAFVVGAALGALATYYFLRDPLPDSEATVLKPRDWAIVPTFYGQGGGGSLAWRF